MTSNSIDSPSDAKNRGVLAWTSGAVIIAIVAYVIFQIYLWRAPVSWTPFTFSTMSAADTKRRIVIVYFYHPLQTTSRQHLKTTWESPTVKEALRRAGTENLLANVTEKDSESALQDWTGDISVPVVVLKCGESGAVEVLRDDEISVDEIIHAIKKCR